MKKKINTHLISWYSENKRNLPWRYTRDPYQIWLSEIILQQTQIKQGLPYYLKFIKAFPTVFDLAKASEDEVLKLWQGLGYYSRARHLHHTAKHIAFELNGQFPESYDDLLKLKGVGDYTASAIASICYDEPTAVVDGNVYRFLARYFGIKTAINSTQGIKEFKAMAQDLLPKRDIGDHNQAIMEFGARQCKPKSPDCSRCSLNSSCMAFRNNLIDVLPVKRRPSPVKKRFFNYIVVVSPDRRTLLQKRIKKDIWQNLFEFPLVETLESLKMDAFPENKALKAVLNGFSYHYYLYNEQETVHKLSHQHIYTKFWIVETDHKIKEGIPFLKIKTFAVPILIANFIDSFNFND